MITIKEIAGKLGVSTTTVSNVIHGKTKEVSKANVERIEKMLKEYDYMPNINARNLASRRSKIIGLVVRSCSRNQENRFKDQFVGELTGAVENRVRSAGYYLMIYALDDVHQIQQFIMSWNLDGLIVCGFVEGEIAYLQQRYKNPIAIIDDYDISERDDCIQIHIEDKKAFHNITDYVIKCGHKKIAFVADNDVNVDHQRFLGYCQAMEEAGLEGGKENFLKIQPAVDGKKGNLDEIYDRSFGYTALVCASDFYAAMLLNDFADRGRKIPEEISITGFDDVSSASLVRPALTTVRQNIQKKGEVAVEKLIDMLEGRETERHPVVIIPTEIVVRDSVKKL